MWEEEGGVREVRKLEGGGEGGVGRTARGRGGRLRVLSSVVEGETRGVLDFDSYFLRGLVGILRTFDLSRFDSPVIESAVESLDLFLFEHSAVPSLKTTKVSLLN